MNNYDLLKALGSLDPKYEAEAEQRAKEHNAPDPKGEIIMTQNLNKEEASVTRRPLYRVLTGVAAAAVFLGVFASIGYVLKKTDPERIMNPGSSTVTEQTESMTDSENKTGQPNILGGEGKIRVISKNLMEDDRYWYLHGSERVDKTQQPVNGFYYPEPLCDKESCHMWDAGMEPEGWENCLISQLAGFKYLVTDQAIYEGDAELHTLYEIDGCGGRKEAASVTREQAEQIFDDMGDSEYMIRDIKKVTDELYVIRLAIPHFDSADQKPNFTIGIYQYTDCLYRSDTKTLIPISIYFPEISSQFDIFHINYEKPVYYDTENDLLVCICYAVSTDNTLHGEGAILYKIDWDTRTASQLTDLNSPDGGNWLNLLGCTNTDDGFTAVYLHSMADSGMGLVSDKIPGYKIEATGWAVSDNARLFGSRLVSVIGNQVVIADCNFQAARNDAFGRLLLPDDGSLKVTRMDWDEKGDSVLEWEAGDLNHIYIVPQYADHSGEVILFDAETGKQVNIASGPQLGYFRFDAEPCFVPEQTTHTQVTVQWEYTDDESKIVEAYFNPQLYDDSYEPLTRNAVEPPEGTFGPFMINRFNSRMMTFHWSELYGELPDGVYNVEIAVVPYGENIKPDFSAGNSEKQQVFTRTFCIGREEPDDPEDSTPDDQPFDINISVRGAEIINDQLSLTFGYDAEETRTAYAAWDGKIYYQNGDTVPQRDGADIKGEPVFGDANGELLLMRDAEPTTCTVLFDYAKAYDLEPGNYTIALLISDYENPKSWTSDGVDYMHSKDIIIYFTIPES